MQRCCCAANSALLLYLHAVFGGFPGCCCLIVGVSLKLFGILLSMQLLKCFVQLLAGVHVVADSCVDVG